MTPRTIAVLGPGGVGGLVGSLLARDGHRVIFLAGEETVSGLRERGITVSSRQFGDFTVEVEAATKLAEHVDFCIITVKQMALLDALDRLPAKFIEDGIIVPLLNGIEHVATLRSLYAPETIAAGVFRGSSVRVATGHIVHESPFIEVDLASSSAPSDKLKLLAGLLGSAGVTSTVRKDEASMLWDKLSKLVPFALLTTYYEVPIGDVRANHRDELLAMSLEVTAVARAFGGSTEARQAMDFYDSFPPEAKSSMQRDAESGRALEFDAIAGAVLRAADQYQLEVPVMRRLVSLLDRSR